MKFYPYEHFKIVDNTVTHKETLKVVASLFLKKAISFTLKQIANLFTVTKEYLIKVLNNLYKNILSHKIYYIPISLI